MGEENVARMVSLMNNGGAGVLFGALLLFNAIAGTDHAGANALINIMIMLSFLWFLPSVRGALMAKDKGLGDLAFASGIVAAGLFMTGAQTTNISFGDSILGTTAIAWGVMLMAVGMAAVWHGILPVWQGWLSLGFAGVLIGGGIVAAWQSSAVWAPASMALVVWTLLTGLTFVQAAAGEQEAATPAPAPASEGTTDDL